jgi:rubrerythrin
MAIFDASEIVEFAVYIEQNGYEFYTETAKKFDNEKIVRLFNYLAEEELKHERVFKELKKEAGLFNPHQSYEGEFEAYMKDFLKSHALGDNKAVKEKVGKVSTMEDALNVALDFEKDSVVFFTTLKNHVQQEKRATIDKIIDEEVAHMTMIFNLKREML